MYQVIMRINDEQYVYGNYEDEKSAYEVAQYVFNQRNVFTEVEYVD